MLAALEVHSGKVLGQSIKRQNSETFIRFLRRLLKDYAEQDLYVTIDDASAHRSKKTRTGAAKQERLHLVYTPTHASWLNQIELFFGILTRKVIRRGIFKSRQELAQRLMAFIESYNAEARPFQWTYSGNPLAVQ